LTLKKKKFKEKNFFFYFIINSQLFYVQNIQQIKEYSSVNRFGDLYLNEYMSDIQLVIDGQRLPAHKFILSFKSQTFYDMFYGNSNQSDAKEVLINGTTVEAMKHLLYFIYLESFDTLFDEENGFPNAIDLCKLCVRYEVKNSVETVEYLMDDIIKVDNFVVIYEFALEFGLNQLLDSLRVFGVQNTEQIIEFEILNTERVDRIPDLIKFLDIKQFQLITVLNKVFGENLDKDLQKCNVFIDLKKASILELKILAKIHLFADNVLNEFLIKKYEFIDKKCEDLNHKNEDLNEKNKELTKHFIDLNAKNEEMIKNCMDLNEKNAELNEKNGELNKNFMDLNKKCEEFDNKYKELLTEYNQILNHYKEVKQIFKPFTEGVGGYVNEHQYKRITSKARTSNRFEPYNKFEFKY
jgi:hypothetical protein